MNSCFLSSLVLYLSTSLKTKQKNVRVVGGVGGGGWGWGGRGSRAREVLPRPTKIHVECRTKKGHRHLKSFDLE